MKQLADGLRGDDRVAVVAVNGIGGVGKTQLAAYFARSRREDYDVVWWVRAEQPATLRSDLTALAAKLALPEASEADEQATISAVREWLAHNPRWLVIFDDASDPDAISGELVDASDGHVLITSRAHGDWRRIGARPLGLDVWQRHESRTFLRARTAREQRFGGVGCDRQHAERTRNGPFCATSAPGEHVGSDRHREARSDATPPGGSRRR